MMVEDFEVRSKHNGLKIVPMGTQDDPEPREDVKRGITVVEELMRIQSVHARDQIKVGECANAEASRTEGMGMRREKTKNL